MTKTEILARLPELPAVTARLKAIEQERQRLGVEGGELRKLQFKLSQVDEVFEGVPLGVGGDTNVRVEGLGEDEYLRSAFVNPVYPPDDEVSEDPAVPIEYRGWLLQLSGAGPMKTEDSWKQYRPDAKAAAVLAAKRFVAHGVVPLPDEARKEGV